MMTNTNEFEVRKYRKWANVSPVYKQIDTMAAEYPVFTNYLYSTYSGTVS